MSSLFFATNNITNDKYNYKFDTNGNITEIRNNNILVARYSYDSLSRIIREDNKEFNKTFTFSYDAGGNILNKLEYAFTLTNNLDYEDILNNNNYNYRSNGWNDQLLRFNNELFEYDKLGNPTLYRDKTLVWSHGRQLDRFDNIEFKYNSNGIRETKIANGVYTKYYLNGTKVIAQTDTNNNTLYFHYGCDGVTSFTLNNVDYVYKKNTQNDIIGIYDINGQEIVKYVYDAWGNHKTYVLNNSSYIDIYENVSYTESGLNNKTIAELNPFRYRSYYYDSETNLYYLNSRYYDSELGRFINADDISILEEGKEFINGLNLYAYCNNNPIKYFDPTGLFLLGVMILLGITAVAGAVVGGVTAYENGLRGWDLVKNIFTGLGFGLAAGGILLMLGATIVGLSIGVYTIFLGTTASQIFAIGALAVNISAYIIMPIFGIKMQGIEYENSNKYKQPYQPPKTDYSTYEKFSYILNKISLKLPTTIKY